MIVVKSVNENVYELILEQIINGDLKAGEKLVIEKLSKELGISSTPIRDAFRRLEMNGLLEVFPRSGSYVKFPTEKEIRDVFKLRLLLEKHAIQEGYKFYKSEDLDTIKSKLESCKKTQEEKDFIESDVMLHDYIVNMSNNIELKRVIDGLKVKVQLYRRVCSVDIEFDTRALNEHFTILDSMYQKDVEQILKHNTEHLDNVLRRTLDAFKKIGK